MQFILIAHDKPGALALRKAVRPQHLKYLKEIAEHIVFGGPMIDAEGAPCGSAIVYEAADRASAERLIAKDPYAQAQLFANTELRAFRTVVRDGVVSA